MEKNVLQWLEMTAGRLPEKIAYSEASASLSFGQVLIRSKRVGSAILSLTLSEGPLAVMMGRDISTITADLGVVYSGRAYAPIDATLPDDRIKKILDRLQPAGIISDKEHLERVNSLRGLYCSAVDGKEEACPILCLEDLLLKETDEEALLSVRKSMLETDPLYIIFTSGSSGNPKGVATSHHSLMCYISAYRDVMGIAEEDRLGCQAPLDYIAAVRDIYLPLLTGAQTYLIPKEFFMQPTELFQCMREEGITAVGWSASALSVLSALGCWKDDNTGLPGLRKICFSGSVLPGKVLSEWQRNLPEAKFVNQYGPTEATASCTYYILDHVVREDEVIPIGIPYDNYRILLLGEDGKEAPAGEEGEICVSGPILALGYWNDPERTQEVFIQNPLKGPYGERIYRTGDIGRLREDGLLEFHGRRDRQIKYMGHRVELDEIETASYEMDGVDSCAALFQEDKEVLWLFFAGNGETKDVILYLRKKLPGFMVPRKVKKLEELPKLPNGKTDMTRLKEEMGRSRRSK
ncbi:MAG: amino acid adenylation domain-containing protein [Lachnospiraceae bacterium]|nr:amino acid adenylation domain-containing protein [Lachnospiraceae bacterium]